MYDKQTHDRKNYFDFIFLPHMIQAQCIDRKGIVQDGKKTGGKLSSLAKTAVGELSGSGIDMIHDQPWGSRCLQFFDQRQHDILGTK